MLLAIIWLGYWSLVLLWQQSVHAGPPLGCMGWRNVELVEKSKVANKRTTTIWTPSRVVKI